MAMLRLICVLVLLGTAVTGSDYPCTSIGGVCQDDRLPCTGGYLTGKCDGGTHRRCCHKDGKCIAIGGTCQYIWYACRGGYATGLCSGPTYRKCCRAL